MNHILSSVLLFTIEFLKLFITIKFICKIKFKNYTVLFSFFVFSVVCISFTSNLINLSKLWFLYGILVVVIMNFCTINVKFKIGYISLVYIIICLFDMIFGPIFLLINDYDINNKLSMLLSNSISLIIIILLSIIIIVKHKNIKILYLSRSQIFTFTLLGVLIGLFSYFEIKMIFSSNLLTKNISIISYIVTLIIFIAICAALIAADNNRKNLAYYNEMHVKLLRMQKDYFNLMLEKEEETRSFRHDISNHLYCMHTLLSNKDYEKLDTYFLEICDELKNLKSEIVSGNYLVDAIIHNQISKYSEVKLDWNGHIPYDLNISNMVLCIIFSNLLSNAFEAASKTNSKKVDVNVKMLASTLYLSIINDSLEPPLYIKNKFISTKKEVGHGYGIQNVIQCVNDNNGIFKWDYEQGYFTSEVILTNVKDIE